MYKKDLESESKKEKIGGERKRETKKIDEIERQKHVREDKKVRLCYTPSNFVVQTIFSKTIEFITKLSKLINLIDNPDKLSNCN